jgi:hypothetical protein
MKKQSFAAFGRPVSRSESKTIRGGLVSGGGLACSIATTCGLLSLTCSGTTCLTRYCKLEKGGKGMIIALVCDGLVSPRCQSDDFCLHGFFDQ